MKFILAILVVFASCALGQRAFNPADPHDEFKPTVKGMAERLAASDFVVVGTVVKQENANTRVFKQQMAEMAQLNKEHRDKEVIEKWSQLEWNTLSYFAIQIEKSLCGQSDFHPGSASVSLPREIYLFNAWRAPLDANYRNEILQPGHRYLFSLGMPEDIEAKLDRFDLDRTQRYFEVLAHSDGAVELPLDTDRGRPFNAVGYKSDRDIATPILEAATSLCEAVKPSNIFQKVDALERLKSSPDLSLRENADVILNLLSAER